MDCNTDRQLFITLKDHKDNFKTNTKWGLINPDKNQMEIVSKTIIICKQSFPIQKDV